MLLYWTSGLIHSFFARWKYPDQDGDDELIATPSAASPPARGSPEDPDAAAGNRTTLFPPADFDPETSSGMLPPLSGEEEPTQKTPVGDPEEAQPTAESETQNKTPEQDRGEISPESKKTQAYWMMQTADWMMR